MLGLLENKFMLTKPQKHKGRFKIWTKLESRVLIWLLFMAVEFVWGRRWCWWWGGGVGSRTKRRSEVPIGAICGVWDNGRLESRKEKLGMTQSMVGLLTCNLLIIKLLPHHLKTWHIIALPTEVEEGTSK